MSGLWTAADAVAATGGRSTGKWVATGVSIDTRSLQKGDLFVALTDNRDGHDFVADALSKGAAAALVSRVPDNLADNVPLLIVDDVLEGLRGLARAARARMAGKVIGVTGSVGKTGSKEMLRCALMGQGRVHAAEKSFNNHWGVPLTLARMPADTDFAVIEIGMNAPGEITPLSQLARPHVAVITTVAAVHMQAFDNVRGIARAKAEIFDGLEPGGIAILNRDILTYPMLARAARKRGADLRRFGMHGRPEFALKSVRVSDAVTTVVYRHNREKGVFKINAPGAHLGMNGLAVLAAVEAVGGDLARAVIGLGQWAPPEGRGLRYSIRPDIVDDGTITLIDESYNANPTSMAAALASLAATQPTHGTGRVVRGQRIAVLGDMLELGRDEARFHADLAALPSMDDIDVVHLVGTRMTALAEALPDRKVGIVTLDATEMVKRVIRTIDAGDVVMVKGSLGTGLSPIVKAIKTLDTTGNA